MTNDHASPTTSTSPPGPPRPINSLAAASLVFAVLFPPIGIALGAFAREEIRASGERGDGLATAGIAVGSVLTFLLILLAGIVLVMYALMALIALGVVPLY